MDELSPATDGASKASPSTERMEANTISPRAMNRKDRPLSGFFLELIRLAKATICSSCEKAILSSISLASEGSELLKSMSALISKTNRVKISSVEDGLAALVVLAMAGTPRVPSLYEISLSYLLSR